MIKIVTQFLDSETWILLSRLLTHENALVVMAMLETGLRVSDVLNIRTSQLSNNLTVEESKTGKLRDVTISDNLLKELQEVAGQHFVFEHRSYVYAHRTRQAVWADIKRAKKALRIKDNIACHSARKTYAVEEWRRTHDLGHVQRLLNHDRPETTLIYLISEFM